MPNILSLQDRQAYIKEIKGEENKRRKEESLKAFEFLKSRQEAFILDKLRQEFSETTVKNMRTVTSINLTPRVINEQASIYKQEPVRTFENVSEKEREQLEALYDEGEVNIHLKKANKYYKLFSQCSVMVIPKDKKIALKILMPHHYDVIPKSDSPEQAEVYVINILDKSRLLEQVDQPETVSKLRTSGLSENPRDGINQGIGDNEDYKASLERMIWWSDDYNFTTDGKGRLIDPETDKAVDSLEPAKMLNALGELPFVDVAMLKDFEFWVREVNNIIPFTETFGVLLSDTSDINRMQGYSQAVISSVSEPSVKNLGPHKILHLPQDENSTVQPSFEFATPSPDMASSLELLETYLRLFLTSNGIDPKVVSGKLDSQRFSSGVERLLSMIEKFDASKDDLDLFHKVEDKVFDLIVKWSNLFQSVDGPLQLKPELKQGTINDKAFVSVTFSEPSIIQTKVEREDSSIKLMDAGLMSKKEVIKELRGVDDDEADKILDEIEKENEAKMPPAFQVELNDDPLAEPADDEKDDEQDEV